jgi:hypothetical protein
MGRVVFAAGIEPRIFAVVCPFTLKGDPTEFAKRSFRRYFHVFVILTNALRYADYVPPLVESKREN